MEDWELLTRETIATLQVGDEVRLRSNHDRTGLVRPNNVVEWAGEGYTNSLVTMDGNWIGAAVQSVEWCRPGIPNY